MKTLFRFALGTALAAGIVPLLAGPASAHQLSGMTITCAEVSGAFHDFGPSDHPIVWHVNVGSNGWHTFTATETPPTFVGTGTATADISGLTEQLHGSSATVQAFATWPGDQSATTSAVVTCGVPQLSPTSPPQVGGIEATAPGSSAVSTPAAPATAVPAAARFTG